MAAGTTLTFDVLAKDRASRTLDHVGNKSRSLGKTLGNLAGIAAGVAVVGGVTMLTGFIKDAQEAAKISRITAAAIKSTGSAAKVTTKQVEDLSERLSNLTAVDDELIQTGANLLLTFKNVRNEAGKGNKIFDQATASALDLSAAGFGSVESAAKMLGKALNDPLKGLTALGKAGVTFTDQQKKTIAKLVEQGDLLSAQKIIMSEIASQVGGAAEAAAGPMDKLKTIVGNLGEELGAVLLPYLEDFAEWLIAEGVPKIEDAIVVFRDEWIPAIQDIWKDIDANLLPVLEKALGFIEDNKDMVWLLVGALVAWKVAQLGVNVAMSANPLIAFLSLVASAVLIVGEMNDVTGDWHKSLETLAAFVATTPLRPLLLFLSDFEGSVNRVENTFITAFQGMLNFVLEWAELVLDGVEAAMGWSPILGPAIRDAQKRFNDFRDNANAALEGIKNRNVGVRISISSNAGALAADVKQRFTGLATGGPVMGIGGPTSDNVLARLSPGEHVWTAKEVQAFGGHKAMALARRQVVHGYAAGGVVTPNAITPPVSATMFKGVNDALTAYTTALGNHVGAKIAAAFKKMANALTSASGPGIPGSGRLFPLPPGTYHRTQGPHDGGAIDYGAPYGTPVRASFSGLLNVTDLGNRSYGKFYQLTAPGQRTILGAHLSSFAHGDGSILRGQLIGRVGSTGNSTGPHLHLRGFDKGGWLPPGLSMAYNGTGQPEKITPADQPTRLHPADIRAIGKVIAAEMAASMGAGAYAAGRRADLLARAG